MKTTLRLLLLPLAIACSPKASCAPAATNEWGPVADGARMSITITPETNAPQPQSRVAMRVRIENVSQNPLHVIRTADPLQDYIFELTSPSGKQVTTQRHKPFDLQPRFMNYVDQGKITTIQEINLRAVLPLHEVGAYTLTIKRTATAQTTTNTHPIELTSNPLKFLITQQQTNGPSTVIEPNIHF
jgi:hypothetical protein